MTRFGIYLRISLDDEHDGLGVARQEKDCRQLLDRKGWGLAGVYVDNNKSAFQRHVRRDGFERLLRDLKSGVIDGFVTYDYDRLARQPSDLERLITIYEASATLHSTSVTNDIDLGTPDGIFMARILINVANKSSKDSSRRIKRKNLERWENGLPHGSRRPYGYNDDQLTLHPIEAPIFHEVGTKFINGWSYKDIATWMAEAGYRTTNGKEFHRITLRNMLRKERYAGVRTRDGVTRKGIWTPIFTEEEWLLIRQKAAEREAKNGNKPAAQKYLLTGLLVCGKCDGYLNGETKRDAKHKPLRRTYACRNEDCGGVVRDAVAIEHFIREAVIFRLDTPELAKLLGNGPKAKNALGDLLTRREGLEARLNGLLDDYVDGILTKAAYARAVERVNGQISDLESEIDKVRRETFNLDVKPGETIREAWMSRPDGWRRELTGLVIKRVVVIPGKTKPYYFADAVRKRFDPSLTTIDWIA